MASSTPPTLSDEMLQEYEARLRAQGVPVDDWNRPGLQRDEIDELLAPLGLTLPEEAYVWWSWRDGSPAHGRRKLLAPTGPRALSLTEAVDVYHEFRRIALSLVEPDIPELADPDRRWHPSWFPVIGPQHPIVIDCATPHGQPTVLRLVDFEDIEGTPEPKADSLGRMVSWWADAIDRGAWRWDTESGEWRGDASLMDEEYRGSSLV